MAFINTVDVYGDNAVADAILNGNLTPIGNEIRDDRITTLGVMAFAYLWNENGLKVLDLPKLTHLGNYALYNANSVYAFILRGSVVCHNDGASTFWGSSIANKNPPGFIYIPAALKTQYQQATNWSPYAERFRALEDYTVDGTIWGDLDENKI